MTSLDESRDTHLEENPKLTLAAQFLTDFR